MTNKKLTIAAIAAAAITLAPIAAPVIGAVTTLPVAAATTKGDPDKNDYGKTVVTIAAKHGTAVYTAPGGKKTSRVLPAGSRWSGFEYTTSNSPISSGWWNLGGNQWIAAKDVSNTVPYKTVVKVHYVPGYGIAVWNTYKAGRKPTGKYLKDGTKWKTFMSAIDDNDVTWVSVGTNQWVQTQYLQ